MAIHIHDFKDVPECLHPITFGRNAAKGAHDEARDSGKPPRPFTGETSDDARGFSEIIQRDHRIDDPAAIITAADWLGLSNWRTFVW